MYRPKTLDEFIGQARVRAQAKLLIEIAKKKKEPLPHILLSGPGGTGKTTLAGILSKETGQPFYSVLATAINSNEDVFNLFTMTMGEDVPPPIIFIDEVHRMPEIMQEDFYNPMEKLEFSRRGGGNAYQLYPWTLIAASTYPGKLSEPLRTRFGIQLMLEPYTQQDMEKIVLQSCTKQKMNIEDKAVVDIARRSKQNPRVANHLIERCHGLSIVRKHRAITIEDCVETFGILDIDERGLNTNDRQYLEALYLADRAVGIDSIVPRIHMDKNSILTSIEPYLVEHGFVLLTGKGRTLSRQGIDYVERQGGPKAVPNNLRIVERGAQDEAI